MGPHEKAPEGYDQPVRRPNPVPGCPLTAALAAVGGKWKLIIVYWLSESPRQFGELRQVMPRISQKVLTEQLRELQDDGIVSRKPQGEVPAPVDYSLTDYGRSVLPLVEMGLSCRALTSRQTRRSRAWTGAQRTPNPL